MDQTDHEKQIALDRKNLKLGAIHLIIFAILIVAGIVVKRGYGHPEYMMVFHGPAAIFLVVGGLKITEKQRRRFKEVRIEEEVKID